MDAEICVLIEANHELQNQKIRSQRFQTRPDEQT
jgi:hypothetical protein